MRLALLDGDTLGESLSNIAKAAPGSVAAFPVSGDQITSMELDGASARQARALLDAGIEPGDLVGVLVPTDSTFLVTIFALWRAGAAVSVLPADAQFGDTAAAARQLARIVRMTGMRHLVLDPAYLPIGQLLRESVPQLTILDPRAAGSSGPLPAVEPESLAIVQFTSGSTSAPKGVMLPHRTVIAGLRACVVSAAFSPDDVFVQWVPTFHDMGLIGLLSHWLNGADVHAFTPVAFLRRPARLLEYFAEHSGTVLTGPNFSYDYLLDAMAPDQLATLDLSSWRLAFNGAEPVSAATVRRFTGALAASGVGESVMYPVYGMAEATLSISYPRPGAAPRIVAVDRNELAAGGTVRALPVAGDGDGDGVKQVVSVGRRVHGIQVRIRGGDRESVRDRQLGEIQIRGDAVSPGYYGDPAATRQLFDDGWLRTGDLGFQLDGDLFVTGRLKEMIIVHGQNFFPEDVEAIARNVPGVYRRRCVAVAERTDDGSECAGVIVESAGPADEIRAEVARRVAAELGLAQIRVHVVKPRWLTRTTSGKWQRALAAKRVAAGETGNFSADTETDVPPT